MSVDDYLMRTGGWSVKLKDDAPRSVRDLFGFYGHVIVTPTRLGNELIPRSALLGVARWTGVIREFSERRTRWGGPGLMAWVGEEAGKGASSTVTPSFPATFSNVLTARFSTAGSAVYGPQGLTLGTSYSPTSTTVTRYESSLHTRAIIDEAAVATGNEWRINPDGTLDYGVATSLFQSTPKVVLVDSSTFANSGLEQAYPVSGYRAIGVTFSVTAHQHNYYRVAHKWWKGNWSGSDLSLTGAADGGSRFSNFSKTGDHYLWKSVQTASYDDYYGTSMPDGDSAGQYEIDVDCDLFDIERHIIPGDYVYLWSPDDDLVDSANQIVIGGETLGCVKARVAGISWPIEEGYGVFVEDNQHSHLTDITDWVEFEPAGCRIYIDTAPLRLDGALRRDNNPYWKAQ